ncbi:MAG TPA: membrane protein insertion efficiency factor YidD [Candidatus Syntrophosphaera thermopropionivorans]|jgi:hypothetical protein|nr:membrane protein insertion efficiency factor YidD [Candidatus Syntrophosphaera thermopropionivorans]HRD00352.1 membrane protein insertion efficiency factor YidD [Candidatus Syntrophosphaera thermopropionivorans]HRR98289.1 membrane protein insertion efficiency factor YidD [Candidatus Syntrophosphaera sp.]HRU47760.1 membrane protein insertion efficiency factor YidD [Candidatus Syntrophosphaera sp.]
MRKSIGVILFFILITLSAISAQNNITNISIPSTLEKNKGIKLDNPTTIIEYMVEFYQKAISPVKQQNCPMYPSCSNYGLEALEKYGLRGIFYTVDRLNRCGHDLQYYIKVIVDDEIYFLDIP